MPQRKLEEYSKPIYNKIMSVNRKTSLKWIIISAIKGNNEHIVQNSKL